MKYVLNSGLNSGDLFTISVLGYSKELHEFIMKGVSHDTVLNNIFEFLKSRKKYKLNGPVLETEFITLPQNEHEKYQYEKFWRGKIDRYQFMMQQIYFLKK